MDGDQLGFWRRKKQLLKPDIQAVLQQLYHKLQIFPASYNNKRFILKVASLPNRHFNQWAL